MGAVHAEIEHLLKESNIRNLGYFVFANTSMFILCWKHYMFMGRKYFRKLNNLDFNLCITCAYVSVNSQWYRRKLEFFISTSDRFHCASPIPYHVFLSCEYLVRYKSNSYLHLLVFGNVAKPVKYHNTK